MSGRRFGHSESFSPASCTDRNSCSKSKYDLRRKRAQVQTAGGKLFWHMPKARKKSRQIDWPKQLLLRARPVWIRQQDKNKTIINSLTNKIFDNYGVAKKGSGEIAELLYVFVISASAKDQKNISLSPIYAILLIWTTN